MDRAVYRFSPEKACSAIHWMVNRQDSVDLHTALKACYFADKSHLNEHVQPIFGATYKAMKYGPVPLEIYEMMKGESLWLWELGFENLPWRLEGYRLRRIANNDPDMSVFGDSEIEHLERAFGRSTGMTFTARTAATHGPDWHAAEGGYMRYGDMVEPSERRDAIVRTIKETAAYTRL